MKVTVNRKAHFNAAHRIHNPQWSDEKNRAFYGSCNNPNFHGHNYEIVVSVTGEIDNESGYVIDMKMLSDIIRKTVIDKFDHKNLNLDTEEFKNLNPTTENLVVVCWNLLRKEIPETYDLRVTLYETERNFVVFPPFG